MSTNVVGAGASPAPRHLGRIAGVAVGVAIALSIGIGIAQSGNRDLTLDRYHPGHPVVSEDRQERIAELQGIRHSGEDRVDPKRESGPGR